MAKRIKPGATVIADRIQARGALREIAELDRGLDKIKTDLNETIDQAKENAAAEAAPLEARRKELGAALEQFAEANKAVLFTRKKSLDLGFGTIGFRLSTSIKTAAKHTWAMVLEKLKDFGFTDAVRTREEVDKDALRGWSDEKLATVGARRVVKDEFYIEIDETALPDQDAA